MLDVIHPIILGGFTLVMDLSLAFLRMSLRAV